VAVIVYGHGLIMDWSNVTGGALKVQVWLSVMCKGGG